MTKLIVAFRNFVNAPERKNMQHAYEMQTNKVIRAEIQSQNLKEILVKTQMSGRIISV